MTATKLPESCLVEFAEALNGGRGAMDAWLEVNDENEVRAHIRAYAESYAAEAVRQAGRRAVDDNVGAFVEQTAQIISGAPFPSGRSMFKARQISDLAISIFGLDAQPTADARDGINKSWLRFRTKLVQAPGDYFERWFAEIWSGTDNIPVPEYGSKGWDDYLAQHLLALGAWNAALDAARDADMTTGAEDDGR